MLVAYLSHLPLGNNYVGHEDYQAEHYQKRGVHGAAHHRQVIPEIDTDMMHQSYWKDSTIRDVGQY